LRQVTMTKNSHLETLTHLITNMALKESRLQYDAEIHKLLSLVPAFEYHLHKAAELQRQISALKLPLKRSKKKK